MIVEPFRDGLVAVLESVPELAGRSYYAPPDVAVAPGAFLTNVRTTWKNGVAECEADVVIVTDAAAHASARQLDRLADAVMVAVLVAPGGYTVRASDERSVDEVDDDRDRRPGRVLTVTRSVRPCP